MMDVELKPCPFCGGPAVLYDSYDYGGRFDNVVQCQVCEIDTVLTITEWNKRPAEDALTAERDALRAQLANAEEHASRAQYAAMDSTKAAEMLENERDALRMALDEAHEMCGELTAERDELMEICDGMKRDVIELAMENVNLAAERDRLRFQLAAAQNRIDVADAALALRESQLAAAQAGKWQPVAEADYHHPDGLTLLHIADEYLAISCRDGNGTWRRNTIRLPATWALCQLAAAAPLG